MLVKAFPAAHRQHYRAGVNLDNAALRVDSHRTHAASILHKQRNRRQFRKGNALIVCHQVALALYKNLHIRQKIAARLLAKAAGDMHFLHGSKRQAFLHKAVMCLLGAFG